MRIVLFSLLFLGLVSCEEKGVGVPDHVKAAFAEKYPEEKNAEWNIDRNNNYEAEFKEDGVRYKADFTPDGMWIETECSLKKKELPKAVREAIKDQYDDLKIVEIEKTVHHKKGLFYDVEFKGKDGKFDIEYNEEGVIIGRE